MNPKWKNIIPQHARNLKSQPQYTSPPSYTPASVIQPSFFPAPSYHSTLACPVEIHLGGNNSNRRCRRMIVSFEMGYGYSRRPASRGRRREIAAAAAGGGPVVVVIVVIRRGDAQSR